MMLLYLMNLGMLGSIGTGTSLGPLPIWMSEESVAIANSSATRSMQFMNASTVRFPTRDP